MGSYIDAAMTIQTEYINFKNRWMISCSYDFHTPAVFSKKMLFFAVCSTVFRGAPILVAGALGLVASTLRLVADAPRLVFRTPMLVAGAPSSAQMYSKCSLALRGVPKHIANTPMGHLYQLTGIPVTPKDSRNACLGPDTALSLTHFSLHFTSFQIILQAPSD